MLLNNKVPYPPNYFTPLEDFPDQPELSLEERADEIFNQMVRAVGERARRINPDNRSFEFLTHAVSCYKEDLSDLIYENLELREQIEQLKLRRK
jgi:hypothetical protein